VSLRRALDAVARWTIRSPWSAIGWAVVPALTLAMLLPATPVDLTFMGVMNRDNEHVGRYFEMSEGYELGGLLLVLLEGEEDLLDDAIERTIEAALGLPSVAAARRPLPLDWLEEQAPWLVERSLFDRWLGLAERPDDLANLAEFAASALALRGAVASVPGARLVEIKMATDPLAEEVGQSTFFELEAAVESALAGSGVTAGFSGLPALSAGDQEQTLGAIKRLTPISLVLVLLLFRIVEKRPGGMLSVAAVLILSIGAALGAVGLLTGKLTVMETFFGVTVFGLGIDFAVHLFVRQREELARGRPFEEALRRTVRGAGRGVVAGCITTAGAFLIAAAAPDPVALHLGLSGGLGLLFCLPLTLLILPSVWVLRERRSRRRSKPAAGAAGGRATPVRVPGLESLVGWATVRPVRCLAVSAVLLAVALAGLPRLQVETRLERIMNRGVPAIAMVDRIQEVLGTNGAPWILTAESLDQARDFARRLDGHPLFSETVSLGTILPADLAERAEALNRVFGPEDRTAAPVAGTGDPWALAVGALRRAATAGPPSLDSLPPGLREKFIAPTGEFLVYAYATDSKADGAGQASAQGGAGDRPRCQRPAGRRRRDDDRCPAVDPVDRSFDPGIRAARPLRRLPASRLGPAGGAAGAGRRAVHPGRAVLDRHSVQRDDLARPAADLRARHRRRHPRRPQVPGRSGSADSRGCPVCGAGDRDDDADHGGQLLDPAVHRPSWPGDDGRRHADRLAGLPAGVGHGAACGGCSAARKTVASVRRCPNQSHSASAAARTVAWRSGNSAARVDST